MTYFADDYCFFFSIPSFFFFRQKIQAFQTLASQFLFFYTYEYIKRKLKSSGRQIQAFDNVLIGMLAGKCRHCFGLFFGGKIKNLLTDRFPFLSGSVNVLITQPLDTYVTMKQSNVLQVKAPAEKSKPRLYAGALLSFTKNPSFSVFLTPSPSSSFFFLLVSLQLWGRLCSFP